MEAIVRLGYASPCTPLPMCQWVGSYRALSVIAGERQLKKKKESSLHLDR